MSPPSFLSINHTTPSLPDQLVALFTPLTITRKSPLSVYDLREALLARGSADSDDSSDEEDDDENDNSGDEASPDTPPPAPASAEDVLSLAKSVSLYLTKSFNASNKSGYPAVADRTTFKVATAFLSNLVSELVAKHPEEAAVIDSLLLATAKVTDHYAQQLARSSKDAVAAAKAADQIPKLLGSTLRLLRACEGVETKINGLIATSPTQLHTLLLLLPALPAQHVPLIHKTLLATKDSPSALLLFGLVLKSLPADTHAPLYASLSMKLKSSPEAGLNILHVLAQSVPLTEADLAEAGVLAAIQKQLKATNLALSELAVAIVALLSPSKAVTKALTDTLATPTPLPAHRMNVMRGLSFHATSDVAKDVVAVLMKETDDGIKAVGYSILTKIAKDDSDKLPEVLPSLAAMVYAKALPAKMTKIQTDSLKLQLTNLVSLAEHDASIALTVCGTQPNVLPAIIENGMKKNLPQIESVLALRLYSLVDKKERPDAYKKVLADKATSFAYSDSLSQCTDPCLKHLAPCFPKFDPQLIALALGAGNGVSRAAAVKQLVALAGDSEGDVVLGAILDFVTTNADPEFTDARASAAARKAIEPCDERLKSAIPQAHKYFQAGVVLLANALPYDSPLSILLGCLHSNSVPQKTKSKIEATFLDESFRKAFLDTILPYFGPTPTPSSLTAAACVVVKYLTAVGGEFDPEFDDPEEAPFAAAARSFVTDLFAPALAALLEGEIRTGLNGLTEADLAVLSFATGELYDPKAVPTASSTAKTAAAKKTGVKQKGSKFGGDAEDEAWEAEMKAELEKKKKAADGGSNAVAARVYTKDELKIISEQTEQRKQTRALMSSFASVLSAISDTICKTDSIVGNSTLPTFVPHILSLILNPPALLPQGPKIQLLETLVKLAECVFEISTIDAAPLAQALKITKNGSVPVPTPCPAATAAIAAGSEVCVEGEETLSAASYGLVFPLLAACLAGPKKTEGCDDALAIMFTHAKELESHVALRRSMCVAILTLLEHDRHQTFTSPTPSSTLSALYDTPEIPVSHSDLAPLLSETGCLGNKAQRSAAIVALTTIAANSSALSANPLVESRVYLNKFSEEGSVALLADKAWETLKGSGDAPPTKLVTAPLVALLNNETMQTAAAKAISAACTAHPDSSDQIVDTLKEKYLAFFPAEFNIGKKDEKKKKVPSKSDLAAQFAPQSAKSNAAAGSADDSSKQLWRRGVQLAFSELGDNETISFSKDVNVSLLSFLVSYAMCDGADLVRQTAVDAGRKFVKQHASEQAVLADLLALFESCLQSGAPPSTSSSPSPISSVWASDFRKEASVILLGSCALHLADSDPKITSTFNMLLAALSTPSESVQTSVAQTIIPLMKKGDTPSRAEEILNNLMQMCLNDESLAKRRGAAYGISACVKGLGIASLKKYEIVSRLEEGCENNSKTSKEGSLFAVELLCERLGLLFEPYVIVLLPSLLKCFGDSSDFVRSAAGACASLIMSKLSAHGVKLVMPAVLSSFDEDNWRTKQASIRMLGSMSSLAPKQLASCLPKIVPKLTEAFSDTHPKVKGSASDALNMITGVIRNPEVAEICPVLIQGLTDPGNHTKTVLHKLLETEFLHAIDAPSLALLIPVLQRGLKDKSGTGKRHSALIVGNMVTMINDPKDFSPYIEPLLPGIKAVLLDPIPDVRATASKCIGSLVRGLGVAEVASLKPWLLDTLKSDTGSSVERSGAAAGLAEYLVASGGDVVYVTVRDEVVPLAKHPNAATREGVLWVLTFLPSVLGAGYSGLIDVALPALLRGLSDEVEAVREVAMRAGRVMIRSSGKKDCDKILPALEDGMTDDNWRIRNCSLGLLGDLLSLLGGTTVAGMAEVGGEDDTRGAEKAQAAISSALGADVRKRVLSRLYMARCDSSSVVRQAAIQVWKTVVSVTPRTLREILPILISQVIDALGSGDSEKTTVAGRCLGDIVKKLGEMVLPEVIPILRDALYTGDEHTKRGVCIGLAEIIEEGSKEQITSFLPTLVPAVRDALCDDDAGVRKMAAGCFQKLFSTVGTVCLDEIVPALLVGLGKEDGQRYLLGLSEVLRIRSKELLPYLLPMMLKKKGDEGMGISVKNCVVLTAIVESCGATIHYHINQLVPPLVVGLSEMWNLTNEQEEGVEAKREAMQGVIRSLCANIGSEGVNWLIGEFAKRSGSDKPEVRRIGCWCLGVFAEERKEAGDFEDDLPVILREVLARLNDEDEGVLVENGKALVSVMKCVSAEILVAHLEFCRNLINSMVSEARRRKGGVGDGLFLMAAFNRPKGLEPLLPMYHQGILYGGVSVREIAAKGLGELIDMTAAKFLAPALVVKCVGPLIRIVGDRNPSSVKSSIIGTLHTILIKAGAALRAFTPQLQTTFVKSLTDTSRSVRLASINALGDLMTIATRVDPLVVELVNMCKSNDDVLPVKISSLQALARVVAKGGAKVKAMDVVQSAFEVSTGLLGHGDENVRESSSIVIGSCVKVLGDAVGLDWLKSFMEEDGSDAANCYAISAVCGCIDMDAVAADDATGWRQLVISNLTKSNSAEVLKAGSVALGALLTKSSISEFQAVIIKRLGESGEDMSGMGSNDEIQRAVLGGLKGAGLKNENLFEGKVGVEILKAAMLCTRSLNSTVILAANKFLYVGLRVEAGVEGVEEFARLCGGDLARTAKDIREKVLVKWERSYVEEN
jgi:hypothetical protein